MKHWIFAFALLFLIPSWSGAATQWLSEVRYRIGDETGWQDLTLDESDWEQVRFSEVPGAKQVFWIRGELEVAAAQRPAGEPLALFVSNLATCEVYWDSELLPRNGQVGASPADETPGMIQYLVQVPDRLADLGRHLIALRCSTHHRHFDPNVGFWAVGVGPYGPLAVAITDYSWKSLVSLSGMVILGVFFLVQFVLQRSDRSQLVLGLFCWTGAALLVAESWRSIFPYTYNWHLLRLGVVTGLAWLLSVLLIAFLITRFRFGKPAWLLLLAVTVATTPIILSSGWDGKVILMLLIIFLLGLGLSSIAFWRGERGSGFVVLGLLLGLGIGLMDPQAFADQTLFLALDLLMACLLISYAVQARRVRQERQAAKLKSARLEIELLKRSIQPHFLMNTLTALAEWFEEAPEVAGQLIQALAEEFRLLSEISSETLISMQDELRLCACHMEIMSRRGGCRFNLLAEGIDPQANIPPAVLHTLVENAITHNQYLESEINFHLHQEQMDDSVKWIFEAPLGKPLRVESAGEGTGLKYIRARLDEAFGSGAQLNQEAREGYWRTEILVPVSTQLGSG